MISIVFYCTMCIIQYYIRIIPFTSLPSPGDLTLSFSFSYIQLMSSLDDHEKESKVNINTESLLPVELVTWCSDNENNLSKVN